MAIKVKICGVSTEGALDAAVRGGASHVGFVFFPKSPRNISLEAASGLRDRCTTNAKTVAVLVDPSDDQLDQLVKICPVDVLQLHGSETPQRCNDIRTKYQRETWKAVGIRTRSDLPKAHVYNGAADYVLFDAKPPPSVGMPGGAGMRFDWGLIAEGYRHSLPWILSGGLDAGNIAEAVAFTGARFVDVSSGVESAPGIKDVDKIAAFLKAAADL